MLYSVSNVTQASYKQDSWYSSHKQDSWCEGRTPPGGLLLHAYSVGAPWISYSSCICTSLSCFNLIPPVLHKQDSSALLGKSTP